MDSVRADHYARQQSATPVTCDCHPNGGGVVMAKRHEDGELVILKRRKSVTHYLTVDTTDNPTQD